jgi:hypothetical protein
MLYQYIASTDLNRQAWNTSLFLIGWLALIFQLTPAHAQSQTGNVLLSQVEFERLPPPPPIPGSPDAQQFFPGDVPTPDGNLSEPGIREYRAPTFNQYNQNLGRYIVYVDSSNFQVLQQVRRVEPNAYIRRVQGRSVIQAGVFSRESNAQQRGRELRAFGINRVRIAGSNEGEIPNYPDGDNFGRERSKAYYVVIPADSQDFFRIEDRIRRVEPRVSVIRRNNPRGSHIAVGPFIRRSQAEQWNSYLKDLGFGNARVYYGD